jgi:peptidoglycan/xylan/chitin deacetylase (PgdA/CDA1 family)
MIDCALYYGTDIIRPYPDSLTSSAPFPSYPGGFSTIGASDPFNLGCQNPGQIALTFDDGPGTPTIAILDILKANDVTAAFFILGRNINGYTQPDGFFQEGHPALIERMIAEGHIVADHSYDHKDMLSVPTSVLASQISATDAATTRVVGKSMKFFRFPYFSYNKSKLDYLTKTLKKIVVFANLDTKDYQDPNWLSTWDSILSSSDPRLASFIALNHDLYAQTATNLQGAIDIAKQRGYRFVSLEECLGWNAYD